MKIPNFHTPTRQENPSVPPQVLDAMKTTFRQLGDLTRALQGQASIVDNLNVEVVELTAAQGVGYEVFLTRLKGQAIGALPIYAKGMPHPQITFSIIDEQRVRISASWDPAPTAAVFIRVLVLGG
jgi:hypothetical protein